MKQLIAVSNPFHPGHSARFWLPENRVISARTYRRVVAALCGSPTCRCFSSPVSGDDVGWLASARPLYENGRIVAYELE